MFLLTLKRLSEENIFHDPYADGVYLIWKTFFSEEKAKAEMLADFNARFDGDSDAKMSDSRIEVAMTDDKYTYDVSKVQDALSLC